MDAGAHTIHLSDTTGIGRPSQVRAMCEQALAFVPAERFGLHMHDTYGRAVANCIEALELGVMHFDASTGGCGGCPYAPGASGNMASADLLRLLDDAGVPHGVHHETLGEAQTLLEKELGRELKRS